MFIFVGPFHGVGELEEMTSEKLLQKFQDILSAEVENYRYLSNVQASDFEVDDLTYVLSFIKNLQNIINSPKTSRLEILMLDRLVTQVWTFLDFSEF